jgi:hypothetical protein
MLYIICNLGFFNGLSVSWLGLRPLLLSIGLSALASVFTWILLFALFAGALRISAWLIVLLGVRSLPAAMISILPFVVAIGYGFTIVPRYRALWPPTNEVLLLAVMVFALGTVGFCFETGMIAIHGRPELHGRLRRIGDMLLAPYLSASVAALALLWFSIAS